MATDTQLNLAIIGCGKLGKIHAQCLKKIPRANLLAYADVVEAPAQQFLGEFGGQYATSEPRKIFDDPRIDAVYICTRHDSHAPLAIAAAQAGKHILIEKPVALTRQHCADIAAAVRQANVHLMPAFKMRYYPLLQKARELCPKPQVLLVQIIKGKWADSRWEVLPEQGGGNIMGQACHGADLMRYLAGSEATHVFASGGTQTHPGHSFPDQCMASVRLADGRGAMFVQGDAGEAAFTSAFFVEMFQDNRSVQLYDRMMKAHFHDGQKAWVETRDSEEGFDLENVEFVSAILEGRAPCINVHDAVMSTLLPLAAIESMRTGKAVEVGGGV